MNTARWLIAFTLSSLLFHSASFAEIYEAKVERLGPDTLSVRWKSDDPIDVYVMDRPDAALKGARILAQADRNGAYSVDHADRARRYFVLLDPRDRRQVTVAERLVPLAQGSNFRDIGGYVGAGGKHVRWGLIYRSAGQPLLTPEDVDQIKALGVAQLVDLRSSEERVIAPTRITGVPYTAVGYSMREIFGGSSPGQMHNGADVYRNLPHLLAPQLRIIFADLLHRQTPIVYNCSAGQDRTGFTTAIILSALGVPRDVIVADYELSTKYRRPEYEMPKLDPAAHPDDPVVQLFARSQQRPNWRTPQPLVDAEGRPFLRGAFEEIEAKWGSVEGYLDKQVGVSPADIETLRRLYLE
jgi:protein-tyrosine phosphatase